MFNIQAELSGNLRVYDRFFQNRSAVNPPQKPMIPLVWDLYMDTEKPLGEAGPASSTPIAYTPENTVPAALEAAAWENAAAAFLEARYPENAAPAPFSASTEAFAFGGAGEGAAPVTLLPSVSADVNLLGAVNDRLKTQARRYPHPITNEMDHLE